MALTRSMLTDMRLDEESIAAILRAHESTLAAHRAGWEDELRAASALRNAAAECDTLRNRVAELEQMQERAEAVQAEFDAYRRQLADDAAQAEKGRLLRTALRSAGANEQLIDLLAKEVDLNAAQVTDGVLVNAHELIQPLQEKWNACFTQVEPIPAPRFVPAGTNSLPLTRAEVLAMHEDDINSNWEAVQDALHGNP